MPSSCELRRSYGRSSTVTPSSVVSIAESWNFWSFQPTTSWKVALHHTAELNFWLKPWSSRPLCPSQCRITSPNLRRACRVQCTASFCVRLVPSSGLLSEPQPAPTCTRVQRKTNACSRKYFAMRGWVTIQKMTKRWQQSHSSGSVGTFLIRLKSRCSLSSTDGASGAGRLFLPTRRGSRWRPRCTLQSSFLLPNTSMQACFDLSLLSCCTAATSPGNSGSGMGRCHGGVSRNMRTSRPGIDWSHFLRSVSAVHSLNLPESLADVLNVCSSSSSVIAASPSSSLSTPISRPGWGSTSSASSASSAASALSTPWALGVSDASSSTTMCLGALPAVRSSSASDTGSSGGSLDGGYRLKRGNR
mmetsp:Transcript_49699/g.113778  ORF Transcript_49699/g.113778 Transcript_49699/m.113778 type:complete len:360 (-) Transcript_49699:128-1207(-)